MLRLPVQQDLGLAIETGVQGWSGGKNTVMMPTSHLGIQVYTDATAKIREGWEEKAGGQVRRVSSLSLSTQVLQQEHRSCVSG